MTLFDSKHWLSRDAWLSLQREQTTAHRVFSAPELWIERYEEDLLVSSARDFEIEQFFTALRTWSRDVGFEPKRIFHRSLVRNPGENNASKLIEGNPFPPFTTQARENGILYHIDFSGYSAGLFLDQRANRRHARKLRPKKLLNCFAYTCAFSVAAALEGAETTSIDISKKILERGKENFALNRLDASQHYFIADDVRGVLPRLAKKGLKFDCIILDPPTFAREKGKKIWKIEKEFSSLIRSALDCAAPKAHLLLSTNCRSLSVQNIVSMARKLSPQCECFTLPPPPDIPSNAMPATTWMVIDS